MFRITSGKSLYNILWALVLWIAFIPGLYSQTVKSINVEKIPQKKVRKYILLRKIDRMTNFDAIQPSWKTGVKETDFRVTEKKFRVNGSPSEVWNCYHNASPLRTWNGHTYKLGLMLLKNSNSVLYTSNTSFPSIEVGQVFFLNLKLLFRLVNLPVAFEVINVDERNKTLEISYLDDNKSLGKQTITFSDYGNGRTLIVHRTYFRSDSWFRDVFLYPHFHKLFIKEFHRNMMNIYKNSQSPDVSVKRLVVN